MNRGFTLIELLLVIAIIAILSYMAVPLSFNFYRLQAVEGARTELITMINKARRNAVLQKFDSRFGIKIDSLSDDGAFSNLTLYKGASYDSRDDSYDEVYPQTPNLFISVSGSSALSSGDINFEKLSGLTSATGTVTIRHGGGNEERTLIIDNFGNAHKE